MGNIESTTNDSIDKTINELKNYINNNFATKDSIPKPTDFESYFSNNFATKDSIPKPTDFESYFSNNFASKDSIPKPTDFESYFNNNFATKDSIPKPTDFESYFNNKYASYSDLSNKVDIGYIDDKLLNKADIGYIDDKLLNKADIGYIDNQLLNKADIGYIDDKLSNKANIEYIDDKLFGKADIGYVNNAVGYLTYRAISRNNIFRVNTTDVIKFLDNIYSIPSIREYGNNSVKIFEPGNYVVSIQLRVVNSLGRIRVYVNKNGSSHQISDWYIIPDTFGYISYTTSPLELLPGNYLTFKIGRDANGDEYIKQIGDAYLTITKI